MNSESRTARRRRREREKRAELASIELAAREARGNFTHAPGRYHEGGDLFSLGGACDHSRPRLPEGHEDPSRYWSGGGSLSVQTSRAPNAHIANHSLKRGGADRS